MDPPQLRRYGTRNSNNATLGHGEGAHTAEMCYQRHKFAPRIIGGYGYIFIYYSRETWAANGPSKWVIERMNGQTVLEITAGQSISLQDLADTLYQVNIQDIVIGELQDLQRTRGRPRAGLALADRLGAVNPDNNDILQLAERVDAIAGAECVGLGNADGHMVIASDRPCEQLDTTTLILPEAKRLADEAAVLDYLFPEGYDMRAAQQQLIVAVTNEQVNRWNEVVQNLNPTPAVVCKSKDIIADVDNDFGHLETMLTKIKVGDVCFFTHTISRDDEAVHNARCVILEIKDYHVRVQTLGTEPKVVFVPRIRTKIMLNKSLEICLLRTQFPLKLAYASTINKAQSQSLHEVVVNIAHALFARGMLYVALTRIRDPRNIAYEWPDECPRPRRMMKFGAMPTKADNVSPDTAKFLHSLHTVAVLKAEIKLEKADTLK